MTYQKFIDISIRVFLCILPLFLFKHYIPSFAQGLFFLMGSFCIYGLTLGTPPQREFKNTWIKFIYLWLLICVFFKISDTPPAEWFNFWLSSAGFLYVLAGMMLFKIVYSYSHDIKKFIYPILVVCIANLIMVLFQMAGHDFLWEVSYEISGLFSSSNQLSQYSIMAIPLLYFINPLLALIPITTLMVSGSLSGHLALFVGVIFLAMTNQIKKVVVVITIAILSIGFLTTQSPNKLNTWFFISRLPAWEKSMNFVFKKPWLGYGYQSYTEVTKGRTLEAGRYDSKENPCSDIGHNWVEFGTPIIAFVGLFFAALWDKFRGKKRKRITYFFMASVMIGLANMTCQNMIRFASVGGLFIIILALTTRLLDEED